MSALQLPTLLKLNNWFPVDNSGKCFDNVSQSFLQNIWFCPARPFPRLRTSWVWLSPTCSLHVYVHTCTQNILTHMDCAISNSTLHIILCYVLLALQWHSAPSFYFLFHCCILLFHNQTFVFPLISKKHLVWILTHGQQHKGLKRVFQTCHVNTSAPR